MIKTLKMTLRKLNMNVTVLPLANRVQIIAYKYGKAIVNNTYPKDWETKKIIDDFLSKVIETNHGN